MVNVIIGIVIGLVLVQLYPPSAQVGVWLVAKAKEFFKRDAK